MTFLSDRFESLAKLYTFDEDSLLDTLITTTKLNDLDHENIQSLAQSYVEKIRADKANIQLIDKFLLEYDLSSQEGLTLMRLAEALIRTPDFATGRLLMRDKLNDADWTSHTAQSDSIIVNQATLGLRMTKAWVKATGGVEAETLAARLGDHALQLGVTQAMKIMGQHFVLGRNIKDAVSVSQPAIAKGFTHSYDMLGEAAYTQKDAEKYYQSYLNAITYLANETKSGQPLHATPGISIKLSALHPRYEYAQRNRCVPDLVSKVIDLAKIAKGANLGLTIDAEETDRLEVSLLIFEQLLTAPELADWDGLGLVVQAYQRRASQLISNVIEACRSAQRKITVRLVKGAYWDMEIKRAQELGLESYPVFTRKENTDISYVACARLLLEAPDFIYPQFATHNALTTATIIHMTKGAKNYEFQRLHGMGTALHEDLMQETGVRCRVYAPVGHHKDLLPYLVRRLLENGANSSFVNQQFDENIPISKIAEDPFQRAKNNLSAAHPQIPAPTDIFDGARQSAKGLDFTQSVIAAHTESLPPSFTPYLADDHIKDKTTSHIAVGVFSPSDKQLRVGNYLQSTTADIERAVQACQTSKWPHSFTVDDRANCLERVADLLEDHMEPLLQLLTLEAGKAALDGVAEIREAVDFCRYYAHQARREHIANRTPLGIIACISPWNFPLAIFLGQIVASLVTGNTVIAKPAEQTPLVAHKAVKLLYAAGIPKDALHLIMGDGAKLGSHLTRQKAVSGVCFTGSTFTAKKIAESLAETGRSSLPFIAETGGLNALIIDSTALIERAVQDVIDSSFQSAGQRCSACRLVCIQDDIADDFIEMLAGAMAELEVGDPAYLKTDVGPVIDAAARDNIASYVAAMREKFNIIGQANAYPDSATGHFIRPIAFEIDSISDLEREIFGPVLHIVRFKADNFTKTVEDINALGFGLTMGLHTRLDSRVEWVKDNAKVGNLYINRNQIGAVVGVQPFGGEGLSGTGPKAGGPHYLMRLSKRADTPQASEIFNTATPIELTTVSPSQQAINTISNARKASKTWAAQFSQTERRKIVKNLFSPHIQDEKFWSRLDVKTEINLPGPTGEINILRLKPRGVILSMSQSKAAIKHMALALSTGNSLIVSTEFEPGKIQNIIDALFKQTQIKNLIGHCKIKAFNDMANGPIDGLVVDKFHRNAIGDFLCRRHGPILPLLSSDSDPQRFYHERTSTNNITAAGGNTSLLTLD